MKIKEEYVLQQIADQWVVIDTDTKSVNFNNILSLNNSARFLWNQLEEGSSEESLAKSLVDEFGIDMDLAKKDAKAFVAKLAELGCIEE